MRIALVHGNDGSDVRIGKTCRSLMRLGHDVHLIGWDRRPDEEKQVDLGGARRHLMIEATAHGRANLSGHLRYMAHVWRTLLKLRPRVLCAVNEDNAFLLLPLKGIAYEYLVCDVFDALVDRHSHRPPALRTVLRTIAEGTRIGADRLIATDEARFARFGRFRHKTDVVQNVPEDPGPALAAEWPTGPPKIYVSGTLAERRGLRQIIEAADRVPDLEIVSAGWRYDDLAKGPFAEHPRVRFEGVVTAARSLELAANCDAVLAYYRPNSVNNVFASPNKIYDAMSVGRPVIINSEVRVSRWVAEQDVGLVCGWDDVDGLCRIAESLPARRASLPEFAARVRSLFTEGYTWEVMERRLASIYDRFLPPDAREPMA